MYRHTQIGRLMLALDIVLALLLGIPGVLHGAVTLLVGAGIAILVAVLFSTLTIEVADGVLRHHFGPGFWTKRIPLGDVAVARPSRSRWYEGIGIRITPTGMLYNVATGAAVEIRLLSGQRFRLGTDQQAALLAALGPHGAPPD